MHRVAPAAPGGRCGRALIPATIGTAAMQRILLQLHHSFLVEPRDDVRSHSPYGHPRDGAEIEDTGRRRYRPPRRGPDRRRIRPRIAHQAVLPQARGRTGGCGRAQSREAGSRHRANSMSSARVSLLQRARPYRDNRGRSSAELIQVVDRTARIVEEVAKAAECDKSRGDTATPDG